MTTNLPQVRERIGAADFQTVAKFLPAGELGGTLAVSENEKAVVMRGGRVVDMFSGRAGRIQTDSEVVVASLRQYHMVIGFGDCSRSPYNQPPMRIHAVAPEFQASNGEAIRSMTVVIAFSLVRDDRANVEKLLSLNSARKDAITVQDLASDLTLPPFIAAAFASAETSDERSIRFDEAYTDKVRERALMAANMMLEQYGVSANRVALNVNATSRDAELALPEIEREASAEHAAEMARLNTRVARIDAQIEAERRMLELDALSHQREMLRTAMMRHWEERAEIQARIEFLDPRDPRPASEASGGGYRPVAVGGYAAGEYGAGASAGAPSAPPSAAPGFWLHEDEAEITLHAGDCAYVSHFASPPKWKKYPTERHARSATIRLIRGCRACYPLPGDPSTESLSIREAIREGLTQRAFELISAGADVNDEDEHGYTPLHASAAYGRSEIAQALIIAGADPNVKDENGNAPLHFAVDAGHAEIAQALIDAGADIHARDENGNTLLHTAASKGHTEIARALIAAGANIDAKREDGGAPLHDAAGNGHIETTQALIDAGADIDAKRENGDTALLSAIVSGHIEMARTLIAAGADVNARRENRDTVLLSAIVNGHIEMAQTLIAAGADVNAMGRYGDTPLHTAAVAGDAEMARALIAAGADINAKDGKDNTPLRRAVDNGHVETARALVAAGADVNVLGEYGHMPLHSAAWLGETEVALALIGIGADPNARDKRGNAPLHTAARNGKSDTAQALIAAGADVHAMNEHGGTPLHAVAISNYGKPDTAQALIAAGADINARNDNGDTPLHAAARNGKTEVALALISAGADVKSENDAGITPFHFASGRGHTETERALIRAGVVTPRKSWLSRLMSR